MDAGLTELMSPLLKHKCSLMYHAMKCNGCFESQCQQMKLLLAHMRGCELMNNCPFPECSELKATHEHWGSNCTSETCSPCIIKNMEIIRVCINCKRFTFNCFSCTVCEVNGYFVLCHNCKPNVEHEHPLTPVVRKENFPPLILPSPTQERNPQIPHPDPVFNRRAIHELTMLLHAMKCTNQITDRNYDPFKCKNPLCSGWQKILKHMKKCEDGVNCRKPKCVLARELLSHWNNCDDDHCSVCVPVKQSIPNE